MSYTVKMPLSLLPLLIKVYLDIGLDLFTG
jgi:hypothetical protein